MAHLTGIHTNIPLCASETRSEMAHHSGVNRRTGVTIIICESHREPQATVNGRYYGGQLTLWIRSYPGVLLEYHYYNGRGSYVGLLTMISVFYRESENSIDPYLECHSR